MPLYVSGLDYLASNQGDGSSNLSRGANILRMNEMKKLLAALAIAIVSASAVAGGGWNGNHGGGGWNNGWHGNGGWNGNRGWNNGWRGNGCWNCGWGWNNGWAVAGSVAAGVAIGAAIASPPVWASPQPVFVSPQPQVIVQQQPAPIFIQQPAPQVIVLPPQQSDLSVRLAEIRTMYDNKQLSYPEYYALRAEILRNFSMPR